MRGEAAEPDAFAFDEWTPPAASAWAPILLRLANETDKIISFEVRNGCVAEVETMLAGIRKTILEGELPYGATAIEDEALDRLWVNLLRLGLFDELLYLIEHHKLPLRSEVGTLIHYCRDEYRSCKERGEAYRARHPGSDIFTMGCIVWGAEYRRQLPAIQSSLDAFRGQSAGTAAQGQIVFSIVTDAAGEQRLRADPLFNKLSAVADFEFTIIPDSVIANSLPRPSGQEFLHPVWLARSLLHL